MTIGDFANVPVDGKYRLVYVVFNTFFALPTQEDQVRCFANVAAHLVDGGAFALERFVPDVARFDRGQRVQVNRLGTGEVMLDASRHDPVEQRIESEHIVLTEEGTSSTPSTSGTPSRPSST